MHTQRLTDNTQEAPHELERTQEAAVVGEIASRFIELKEATSAYRASLLISKLHALSQVHPEALWVVLSLLTGDLDQVTKSYAEMGREHGRTKQGQQQQLERTLAAIDRHFPKLATAIIELRHITAEFKPPAQHDH